MANNFYLELQHNAERIVEEAAKILVGYEKSFSIATQKDIVDVATNADVEAEKFIKSEVKKLYPDHGFYGEEFGEDNPNADFVWVIDPLDCTKDYVQGIGEYNCLIAVEDHKQLVAGVVRRMGHNQLFSSSLGNGAYRDKVTKLAVTKTNTLDIAFVGTNVMTRMKQTPVEMDTYFKLFKQLMLSTYRLRTFWDDSRLMSWVAQGSIDATLCLPNSLKWFDVAPAILLVEEAGGKVTNWKGELVINHDLSNGILASNGILHEQLLTIIQKEIYAKP
ncbi:MAG: inositol monophosphatase family protein [Candidatus Gottesmanbacteria bacterium]